MRLVKKDAVKVGIKWVRGHLEDPLNKRVDQARQAIRQLLRSLAIRGSGARRARCRPNWVACGWKARPRLCA